MKEEKNKRFSIKVSKEVVDKIINENKLTTFELATSNCGSISFSNKYEASVQHPYDINWNSAYANRYYGSCNDAGGIFILVQNISKPIPEVKYRLTTPSGQQIEKSHKNIVERYKELFLDISENELTNGIEEGEYILEQLCENGKVKQRFKVNVKNKTLIPFTEDYKISLSRYNYNDLNNSRIWEYIGSFLAIDSDLNSAPFLPTKGANIKTYIRSNNGIVYDTEIYLHLSPNMTDLKSIQKYIVYSMQEAAKKGIESLKFEIYCEGTKIFGLIVDNIPVNLPLSLDRSSTLGFKCQGNTICAIYGKGLYGVPPYKYELWNKERTQKLSGPDGSVPSLPDFILGKNEVASWTYGNLGDEYTIKISDSGGHAFFQGVNITDLDEMGRIAYVGSPICRSFQLYAQAIGVANYEWRDPDNNVISNERSPRVTNGKSGNYTVNITIPECGDVVTRTVPVQVPDPLAITPLTAQWFPNGATKDEHTKLASINSGAVLISSVPTNGVLSQTDPISLRTYTRNYSYQWQRSTDGITWKNIPRATTLNYKPYFDKPGEYYYRCNVEDYCGWHDGEPLHFSVEYLWIPVNPHLMSVPWSPTP